LLVNDNMQIVKCCFTFMSVRIACLSCVTLVAQQQEEDKLLAVGKHCIADTAATVHHTGGPVHHTAEAERIVEGGTAAGVEDMAVDPGTVDSLAEVGPGRAAVVGSRGLGAGNLGEEAEVNTHHTAEGETPHETYVQVVAGCIEAALYLTCSSGISLHGMDGNDCL